MEFVLSLGMLEELICGDSTFNRKQFAVVFYENLCNGNDTALSNIRCGRRGINVDYNYSDDKYDLPNDKRVINKRDKKITKYFKGLTDYNEKLLFSILSELEQQLVFLYSFIYNKEPEDLHLNCEANEYQLVILLALLDHVFLEEHRNKKFQGWSNDILNAIRECDSDKLNKVYKLFIAKAQNNTFTKSNIKSSDADTDLEKIFSKSFINTIRKNIDEKYLISMSQYLGISNIIKTRHDYKYAISLSTSFPECYNTFPGIDDNLYFLVKENYSYELKYITDDHPKLSTNQVFIGFSFNKNCLDKGLLENEEISDFSKCIFNEQLDITEEAMSFLRNLSADELMNLYNTLFTAVIKIDHRTGELKAVEIKKDGIIAMYQVDFNVTLDVHNIWVVFRMPKLWNSVFEVTLVDPTYSPTISFDYNPDQMDVLMYSYLNNRTETNAGAYELQNGLFNLTVKDEWIFPKSGVVFLIKRKGT